MIFLDINIAFQGGGIKGLAYVGVLRFLDERGYKVFKASGSSVGAIFAALAVAKYKAYEIEEIIETLDINNLICSNSFINGIQTKGINNICNLESKIEEILAKKNIKTFQDLKYGDDYLLKIIVTDNKKKIPVILPNDLKKYGINCDSFKVAKAVAMSCSIPIIFSEYKIGNYCFVDGGATYRFPLEVIVDRIHPVLGVKLMRKNVRVFDFFQNRIYKTKENQLTNNNIVIIEIDTLDLKATQFLKGLSKRKELYNLGYTCIKRKLTK